MYFGGNNHGCQEYSKNVYKYTQADRLDTPISEFHRNPSLLNSTGARLDKATAQQLLVQPSRPISILQSSYLILKATVPYYTSTAAWFHATYLIKSSMQLLMTYLNYAIIGCYTCG